MESTSNPSATPASAMSCLALATSNVSGGRSIAPGQSAGIQLPSNGPMPPCSASLIALRSSARLTACRTRTSLSGLSGRSSAPSSSHTGPALTAASRNLDPVSLVVQELGVCAAVLLEGELHVLRSDWVSVVKFDALAQFERRRLEVRGNFI